MASSLAKLISGASRKCLTFPQSGIHAAPLSCGANHAAPILDSRTASIAAFPSKAAISTDGEMNDESAAAFFVDGSTISRSSNSLFSPPSLHLHHLRLQPHSNLHLSNLNHFQRRLFSTSDSLSILRFNRRRAYEFKERSKDDGTHGELSMTQAVELPALEQRLSDAAAAAAAVAAAKEEGVEVVTTRIRKTALDWMPRPEDYETVYENGKKYKELPIVFINADKNNTKLSMTDARQISKMYTSAGVEGFKGCKRGTNIAAQTSAMSFAKKLVRQSKVTHVRVVVKGIGPGRLSAIEGLVMGGLSVVSITDDTQVFGLDQGQGPGPRPRKARRV